MTPRPPIATARFSLHQISADLSKDVLQAFFQFRADVYAECNAAIGTPGAFRRLKSGFDRHLALTNEGWADILGDDRECIFLVLDERTPTIVGLVRFKLESEPPEYTNVLFLNRERRSMVRPQEVFTAVCDYYGLALVKAGRVESNDGTRHLRKCGFVPEGIGMVWRRRA